MTKIKNNPIMKGVSGMLGDVVVYREYRGNIIMANRPRKREVLTPHQKEAKEKFLRAVNYAKKQIADPVTKAEYQPRPNGRFTSAYAAAVADYLGAPKVNAIDTSSYTGAIGSSITIKASDNFKIVTVHVAISNSSNTLLEQGNAVLVDGSTEEFVYRTTVANTSFAGTKVLVTVRDKPGNITTEETVL